MFEAQSIEAEHKDLIHDVAYDFYGQRMATCSSDQFVKVNFFILVRNDLKIINFIIVSFYFCRCGIKMRKKIGF